MVLPPNVTAAQWESALAGFRSAVGAAWVFTSQDDVGLYRDAYSPIWDEADERLASAAVAPKNVEEVQAVVRVARQYKIPLFPISTGKNLGYGGSAPNLTGSVVVDLKRMNRIIEVDDKRNFAIVEPGVSYFDLYNYIQERKLKVWVDVPDPGWGSVIGNALDHGVGHTWQGYRDHFGSHSGLEVVLPDGEVMRTGMGAMPGAKTSAAFRYGFGPSIDGLFAQAGFGIVTQMGIQLMPEPEAFLQGRVIVSRREDLIPLVEVANRLEDSGLIGMPLYESPMFAHQFRDPELFALGKAKDVWNGNAVNRYAAEKGVAPWSLALSFYGPETIIRASWDYAKSCMQKAIPGVRFEEMDFLKFPLDEAGQEAVKHKVLVGIPNMNVFAMTARSAINPEPADGHLLFAPIIERSGEAVMQAQKVFTEGMQEMGVNFAYAYCAFTAPFTWTPRNFVLATGLPTSRTDQAVNKRSRDTMSKLIDLGAANGFGEYRTPPIFQDKVMNTYSFNNNILRRFCETLKDAVDPDGIIAPGRGGFWPKSMRGGK